MATAVTLHDLSVELPDGFLALDNLSVEIEQGSITGLIGPSGAGKTTLIRTLVGRQRPTGGTVTIFDQPAGSPSLRKQISYMTQSPSVYPDLTALENLNYFATMFGVPRSRRAGIIAEILETVQLADCATRLVTSLSGGQKQRVSLAIALIGEPKLMVLDEPTVGLDPVLREQLWQLFERLAVDGTTIIVSSHAMDEAERCGNLLLIRDGRLLANGSPADLMRRTKTKTVEHSFIKLVSAQPSEATL